MSEQALLTVSEVTSRIKVVLEGGLPVLWVRGEISQFTRHRSGHWYFTLMDDRSMLPCVLWRGRAESQSFLPEVGQMVAVQGKVVVYEKGGRYQFDCFEIRPAGVGELGLAFEVLKKKLDEQGLFDLERKIPIPALPERIGVVTSPEGAALKDVLRVAKERAPWVEFQVIPAAVQGLAAAKEVAQGIRTLDESGWPQIIIIGRGGGAPEDLWAFNEEVVVRAVADCRTPIVSAIGHEVDVTLSDLAADLRAPTPSAAAEMCLPDKAALRERLQEISSRVHRSIQAGIDEQRRWLTDYAETVLRQSLPAIWREETQRTDELSRRLEASGQLMLERRYAVLKEIIARHESLNPQSILSRGYSVVRRAGQPKPIADAGELTIEDAIDITFHKGSAEAIVKKRQSA
jgi:exodeoxyribonuclease VII large subunit